MPYMSKHYFYPYQILLQFIYFCMLVKIKCSDPTKITNNRFRVCLESAYFVETENFLLKVL